MAEMFFDRLTAAVASRGSLCVGLDPSASVLERWGLDDDADGVEQVARVTIEAVAELAAVVKCQVAFFERHGARGYAALERVLADARAAGLLVIADAKRGDIGSTNAGYAEAWLREDRPLCVDAVTVSCYLGARALWPVFQLAHATGRAAFAVVSSSNDDGRVLQTARVEGGATVESTLLAELTSITHELDDWRASSRCIGAVVGAQRRPDRIAQFDGPVLVTGLGAQGHDVDEVKGLRATLHHGAVVANVSRAILEHGPSPDAVRSAASTFAASLR